MTHLTTPELITEPLGYYRPKTIQIDPDLDMLRGRRSVTLIFEHTVQEGVKAMATVPIDKASPEWVLETYMKFNEDYPEALDHITGVRMWAQRLYDGPA